MLPWIARPFARAFVLRMGVSYGRTRKAMANGLVFDKIIGQEPEYNEPPGGKCMLENCDRDAVIEFETAGLVGATKIKLCGEHQIKILQARTPNDIDGTIITETCQLVFGHKLRVEDGRLIREDP
jgi:hypothetical protein